jgi:hypothetical protein
LHVDLEWSLMEDCGVVAAVGVREMRASWLCVSGISEMN